MSAVSYQYAEALYFLGNEKNLSLAIQNDFKTLANKRVELNALLMHPKVSKTDKKALLQALNLNELFTHFLYVLVDNDRLDSITDIQSDYNRLVDLKNEVVRATAISSKPLKDIELKEIQTRLEKKLNRHVQIENRIDPKVLGGLKITYDGNVLDQTIEHFIASLSNDLMKR